MAPAAGFSEVLDHFVQQQERGEGPAARRWHPGIATRPLFVFGAAPVVPRHISTPPRVSTASPVIPIRPQARRFEPRRPARRTLSPSQQHALNQLVALGAAVSADFTAEELRSAFRGLARRYHPDRHPGIGEERQAQLAAAFATVRSNYDVLKTAA